MSRRETTLKRLLALKDVVLVEIKAILRTLAWIFKKDHAIAILESYTALTGMQPIRTIATTVAYIGTIIIEQARYHARNVQSSHTANYVRALALQLDKLQQIEAKYHVYFWVMVEILFDEAICST